MEKKIRVQSQIYCADSNAQLHDVLFQGDDDDDDGGGQSSDPATREICI